MSTAIGSFVNGLFIGIEARHSWEDRKDAKKRQSTLDAQADERHEWDRADRAEAQKERAYQRSERQRAISERNQEQAFWDGLADDAAASYNAASEGIPADQMAPPPAVMTAGAADPATQSPPDMRTYPAAPTGGILLGANRANQGENEQTARVLPPEQLASPAVDGLPARELTPANRAGGSEQAGMNSGEFARRAAAAGMPEQHVAVAAKGDQAAEALLQGINPDTGKPLTRREVNKLKGFLSQVERTLQVAERGLPAAAATPSDTPQRVRQAEAQRQAAAPSATPTIPEPGQPPQMGQPPAQMQPPTMDAPPASVSSPPPPEGGIRTQSTTPGAPPVNPEQTAAGTPRASSEAVQVSAPAAAKGIPGAPRTISKKQREAGSKSFLDHYFKVGAPEIMEHYLRKGQIDKAQAFDTFLKSKEVKEGMAGWARATHAAAIGDERGFIDGIEDAYNATDYFDDGYEMIKGKSGIERDGQGNITGAKVTFKDQQTGREFTQNFNSQEDLFQLALRMMSPEEIFERGYAQVEQVTKMRREMQIKAMQAGVPADIRKEIMEVGEYLSKIRADFSSLPSDQQFAEIMQFLQSTKGLNGPASPAAGGAQPGAQQEPVIYR